MEATAQITAEERKQQSQLNQARANLEQEGRSSKVFQGATAATLINIGELILILGAAITVDVIDVLDLTGVAAILVRFIDIPTLGALWLWRILKHQAGPKKDPTFQLLLAFLCELSPFGIIPTWTIFVLYVYFQDTKLGKKTIGKVEKIAKAKSIQPKQ